MYTYVVETCPKCGGNIIPEVLATYPPVYRKRCTRCGTVWTRSPSVTSNVFDPEAEGFVEVKSKINDMM